MSTLRTAYLSIVFLAFCSAQANARDLRACIRIQDMDRRTECLEGREDPPTGATTIQPQITPNFSPSFECTKATSSIEILICSDSGLAQADFQMGQIYSQVLKSQNNSDELISDQQRWLSLRNSSCALGFPSTIRPCVMKLTKDRIAALTALPTAKPEKLTEKPDSTNGVPNWPPIDGRTVGLIMPTPANDARQTIDEEAASKLLVERVQALLSVSSTDSMKFFKYTVDKKELRGFSKDMTVLRVVYDERVFFDTDKDTLRPEALPVVKSIAGTLKQQNGKVALFVAGHTDSRGADKYNLDLSIRRAEGVARAIKKQGPGTALIWSVGFGKAIPVRPNTSEQNMAYNRRVEFLVASKAEVITAWIKTTNGLCEDETCGITSTVSNFRATPISDNGAKPIAIDIPAPQPVEIEMHYQPIEVGPPLQ